VFIINPTIVVNTSPAMTDQNPISYSIANKPTKPPRNFSAGSAVNNGEGRGSAAIYEEIGGNAPDDFTIIDNEAYKTGPSMGPARLLVNGEECTRGDTGVYSLETNPVGTPT